MRFRVTYTAPVVYQADHPKARRIITSLDVSSETRRQAEIHAIRTVQGGADILSIEEIGKVLPAPPVETIPDVRLEY